MLQKIGQFRVDDSEENEVCELYVSKVLPQQLDLRDQHWMTRSSIPEHPKLCTPHLVQAVELLGLVGPKRERNVATRGWIPFFIDARYRD